MKWLTLVMSAILPVSFMAPSRTRSFAAAQGRGNRERAGKGGAIARRATARVLPGTLPVRRWTTSSSGPSGPSSTGKSVIVSAPTGAGKTLVAEFAIHRALARGRRLAYTTPLKALSNQKYADFVRQFGAEHGGHPHRRREGQLRAPRSW